MKSTLQAGTRRGFLRNIAVAAAGFQLVPGHVLGLNGATPPSEKLNMAFIGVGGRGAANLDGLRDQNMAAICDVDARRVDAVAAKNPGARKFKDYRRMFDAMEKEVDAVAVSTPDHTHAVALMAAIRRGKHVYSEKPLAHTIHEVRTVMAAARERKVATQLGNQGHSTETIRQFCEWIADGAIGPVREVHAIHQGSYGRMGQLDALKTETPVPDSLDWDLWLGPTPWRPYNPVFLPGKWRGWTQFGTGAIGDWTCHVIDPVFWALDLGAPSSVQAETFDYDPKKHFETFPTKAIVRYQFAAKNGRAPVKLAWYEGGALPPKPEELGPDQSLPSVGALVVGEKGKIIYGSHGAGGLRLIPDDAHIEYRKRWPAKSMARVPGHHADWVRACKGGPKASSNFEYGGPLTEIALLGAMAMRHAGQTHEWDGPGMRFANNPAATSALKQACRQGWSLDG